MQQHAHLNILEERSSIRMFGLDLPSFEPLLVEKAIVLGFRNREEKISFDVPWLNLESILEHVFSLPYGSTGTTSIGKRITLNVYVKIEKILGRNMKVYK